MPVLISENVSVPRLIILRGSPAVGKTTISKKIIQIDSAKKKTHIPVDDFQLYDARPMCKDREKLGIRNAAVLSKNFLLEGFDVIVDYVFDDIEDQKNFLEFIFSEKLGKLDRVYVQQFYLDAPIEKVVTRNKSRKGKRGEYMNMPLLRKLHERISKTKGLIEHEVVIDSTKYSPKQCARFIISNNQAYRNNEILETVKLPDKDLARALEKDDEDEE